MTETEQQISMIKNEQPEPSSASASEIAEKSNKQYLPDIDDFVFGENTISKVSER